MKKSVTATTATAVVNENTEIREGFAELYAKILRDEITLSESDKQYRVLSRRLRAETKRLKDLQSTNKTK